MAKSNAEIQAAYRKRMRDKNYKEVQGIYAPDDAKLRTDIRGAARKKIDKYLEGKTK